MKEVSAEELVSGTIVLPQGVEEIVFPAATFERVVFKLDPIGNLLQSDLAASSRLSVVSGITQFELIVNRLADARLSTSDAGDSVQFTLVVPGFEPSTLVVQIEKQAAINAALLVAALAGFSAAAFFAVLAYRRRKREEYPVPLEV